MVVKLLWQTSVVATVCFDPECGNMIRADMMIYVHDYIKIYEYIFMNSLLYASVSIDSTFTTTSSI